LIPNNNKKVMFMKKPKIFVLLIALVIISVIVGWVISMRVNTNFATEALLEFHYESVPGGYNPSVNISVAITDESDISALKEILRGHSFKDTGLACGFSTDISVTMTNGSKSIMLCPANDGCPLLRIGDSNRYIRISEENRKTLYRILKKYGMFFPCI